MRPLSESTARVTGKSFKRKYIALGRLLEHWRDIVGETFADKAQPVKLNYRKSKTGDKKPIVSLDVAVSSADATVMHYQKDLILERINQIFGERWISGIRFVHHAANTQGIRKNTMKSGQKQKRPLTKAQKDSLSSLLSSVEDEAIKERLSRLGEGVFKKNED